MKRIRKHKANGNGFRPDQSVRLEFIHSTAKSVLVAGTFNGWRPGVTEMVSVGESRWLKELVLPLAFTNTGWWWMGSGCRIRGPAKPRPTRLVD